MRTILTLIFTAVTASTPVLAQVGVVTPLDQTRPDESSPFFTQQQLAKYYQTEKGQAALQEQMVAKYPSTGGNDSAPVQMKKFFKEMFGSVRIGTPTGKTMSTLKIDPAQISLEDRREFTVVFRIENPGNQLLKLNFPTSQRVEFLLKDSNGALIEKWSANQTFEEQEGALMINPDERVEYSEILSTRGMKAGETYFVEASLANNPEFTQTAQVTAN